MNRARVMRIDDDADECALVAEVVERAGFEVESFQDATIALERFAHASFDVVLTNLNMPTMHGFSLCERLIGTRPDLPIIVITGETGIETAVEAMRVGAFDFITKPLDVLLLTVAVKRAVERHRLGRELSRTASSDLDDLPPKIASFKPRVFAVTADGEEELMSMATLERGYIDRVLGLVDGNKSRAAQALGIDRRSLYRKLEGWQIAVNP